MGSSTGTWETRETGDAASQVRQVQRGAHVISMQEATALPTATATATVTATATEAVTATATATS